NVLASFRFLMEPARFAGEPRVSFSLDRRVNALIRFGFALANAVHVHFWLDLSPAFSLIVMPLAFTLAAIWYSTGRIRRREIKPSSARLRPAILRLWYRLMAKIPGLGKPREKVRALNGVDLEISTGMFGLLGPNGAGKTTLMRVICNILKPSRGRALFNDTDIVKARSVVQPLIGYLPQDFGLYETLTAREYLHYHALLSDMWDPEERTRLVEQVLTQVGLAERAEDRLGSYSGGMKQRAGIARTLLHLPRIIVVDEPTVGLDPKERVRFRNLLSDLAKDRIVVFSTHIVEDVSGTCRRLAVLDEGQVKYCGSPEGMREMAQGKVYETTIDENRFEEVRSQVTPISHIRERLDKIRMRFIADGLPPVQADQVEPTLEDAYVYLLGRKENSTMSS
ncbi:ABC transporter ATP-binding protein, partial [Acidobacteriota bacterium]